MAERFATYPEMTHSRDDLFCEIPASWDQLRIKQLFQIRKDIAGRLGYPVWSVTQHGLREKDITSGEGQLSMDYSKYQMLRVGDMVMNHMDLITGGVDIGWKEGVTSPDYRVFIPREPNEVSKKYFVYLFRLCYWTKKFYSLGQGSAHLGRWRLPTRAFESIVVPVPTLDEQKQIASFLDYETAKIDALIEKQQQLIALLGEKRQAVISHAVTKGLNPDAPMRDSGVEWLGEVPEHWDVTQVRYQFDVLDGMRIPVSVEERADRRGQYPYYGASGIIDSIDDYIFDEPLVLVCEDGWNLHLRSQPVARPVEGKIWVNNHAHILRPRFGDPLVLAEMLEVTPFSLFVTGTRQPKLTIVELKSVPLAVPPTESEFNELKVFIKEASDKFDSLEQKSKEAVELLRERRTALISAAVTGKIDVRDWKPPSSSANRETEMELA